MAPRTSMLAAAGLATGGYVVTQAFVSSVSGPVSSDGVAHLRGVAANSANPSQGFGTLGYGAAAATTLAAMTTGRGRVARKAEGGSSFDPSTQLGAMAPLGYFDPLGFCKKGDEATFRNLRASEIKHGRVAMMASVGAVFQHFVPVKLPGFESVPSGLAAATTEPGNYGFWLLVSIAGQAELAAWTESDDKEPGNFGDPMNLNQYTTEMRQREINNGRFAMFATMGIIAAELYTGKDAVEQWGF